MSGEHAWGIDIGSQWLYFTQELELQIRVRVPRELIADLNGPNVQHSLVDYIAMRLHRFVEEEFKQKRLTPGAPPTPNKLLGDGG